MDDGILDSIRFSGFSISSPIQPGCKSRAVISDKFVRSFLVNQGVIILRIKPVDPKKVIETTCIWGRRSQT
jgi:hypothetical protein